MAVTHMVKVLPCSNMTFENKFENVPKVSVVVWQWFQLNVVFWSVVLSPMLFSHATLMPSCYLNFGSLVNFIWNKCPLKQLRIGTTKIYWKKTCVYLGMFLFYHFEFYWYLNSIKLVTICTCITWFPTQLELPGNKLEPSGNKMYMYIVDISFLVVLSSGRVMHIKLCGKRIR